MSEVSAPSAWKQKAGKLVELPSGNTARLRAPGIDVFMKVGIIPDSVTPVVARALTSTARKDEVKVEELLDKPEHLRAIFQMYDDVAVYCMVDPQLHEVPLSEAEREEELLYVDELDMEDKIFIFQFAVGGTTDVASFREEQARNVASLQSRANVEVST